MAKLIPRQIVATITIRYLRILPPRALGWLPDTSSFCCKLCGSENPLSISILARLWAEYNSFPSFGSGVICETQTLPGAVIPAKAGIYSASHRKCAAEGLDSRFHGNDHCFERDPIPNDTTTPFQGDQVIEQV